MEGSLLYFLLRAALVLLVAWLLMAWFEQRTVFVPARTLDRNPAERGLAFEEVWFVAEDGVRLHGWWIPHPRPRGALVYCHGNGANIANRVDLAADLHRLGLHVFLFDYRGYGRSRGWPTEQGTYRDARAAFEVVRARYEDAENPPVLVYGASLGGPIAAQLALDKPVRGLVVEASFPSAVELGRHLYPWLPVRWLARYRYDTAVRLAACPVPKLLASSRDDQLVPFQLGLALYDQAAEPKEFVALGGPHDEGGWHYTPAYWTALERFVTRVLGPLQ